MERGVIVGGVLVTASLLGAVLLLNRPALEQPRVVTPELPKPGCTVRAAAVPDVKTDAQAYMSDPCATPAGRPHRAGANRPKTPLE